MSRTSGFFSAFNSSLWVRVEGWKVEGGRCVCVGIFFRNISGLVEVGKRQNNERLDVKEWDQHDFHEI